MTKIELKGYVSKPSYFLKDQDKMTEKLDKAGIELTSGLFQIFFYGQPNITKEMINAGKVCKISIECIKEGKNDC